MWYITLLILLVFASLRSTNQIIFASFELHLQSSLFVSKTYTNFSDKIMMLSLWYKTRSSDSAYLFFFFELPGRTHKYTEWDQKNRSVGFSLFIHICLLNSHYILPWQIQIKRYELKLHFRLRSIEGNETDFWHFASPYKKKFLVVIPFWAKSDTRV